MKSSKLPKGNENEKRVYLRDGDRTVKSSLPITHYLDN